MTERTPLLLLPGLLCDRRLWRHQIDHLGDIADMTVADLTLDESVEGMALRALAAAPPRFALAGLSMGGYVALEIMRQAPERVMGLALLDTSARPDAPEQRRRRHDLIDLAGRGRFKGVTPRLLPLLIHRDRMQDKALTGTIIEMAAAVGREGFVRQQTAIMGRVDSRPDLADIDCPAVVIVGRQDQLTPPSYAEEIADGIPDSDLHILEHCGHLATMERPEETTGHMRLWLDRVAMTAQADVVSR